MTRCIECDTLYDIGKEQAYVESHGEIRYGCKCGGDTEPVKWCAYCGKWQFDMSEVDNMCEDCYALALKGLDKMSESFGQPERAVYQCLRTTISLEW